MIKQQHESVEERDEIYRIVHNFYKYMAHKNKDKGFLFDICNASSNGEPYYVIKTTAKEGEINIPPVCGSINIVKNTIYFRKEKEEGIDEKPPKKIGIIWYEQIIIKKTKEEKIAEENEKKAKKAKKRALFKRMGFK